MATLKISDLSVGDWVKFRGNICTICSIYHTISCLPGEVALLSENSHLGIAPVSELSPIPITPEILKANGLYRHEIDEDNPQRVVLSNHFMLARTYTDADWWRVLVFDEEISSKELFNGIVYSVHQLQHALRLAGADKEIVMPNK